MVPRKLSVPGCVLANFYYIGSQLTPAYNTVYYILSAALYEIAKRCKYLMTHNE